MPAKHDCAKYLRICANFGLMNVKQEKVLLISCILSQFDKKILVSHIFCMSILVHVQHVEQSIRPAQKNLLLESLTKPYVHKGKLSCYGMLDA